MIDHALSLGEDNKVVAFLWHQGEHDAVENTDITLSTKKQFYYEKLKFLFGQVKEKYGKDLPIIAGDFCYEWVNDGNNDKCNAIAQATKKVLKEYGGAFVQTKDLQSNNQAIQNGDNIHFSRQSCFVMGKRYFNKYLKIKK